MAKEGRPGALAAADVWQRLEQYGRAAEAAAAALVQFPDDPDLLFRQAASLEREKKIPESDRRVREAHRAPARPRRGAQLPRVHVRRPEREAREGARARDEGRRPRAVERGLPRLSRLGLLPAREARRGREAAPDGEEALSRRSDDRGAPRGPRREAAGTSQKARERWTRALALEPEDGGAAIRAKLERTAAAAKTP